MTLTNFTVMIKNLTKGIVTEKGFEDIRDAIKYANSIRIKNRLMIYIYVGRDIYGRLYKDENICIFFREIR